jgi:formylglycine-generating enzyme required for sulfatase activity
LRFEFVQVPAGEFVMGSESSEAFPDEKPVHRVRITKAFELGKYEVTQAQWEAAMGSTPSNFKGADRPVEQVSWNDAQEFLSKLNERKDGYRYRLPTEAEWEYAARAGTTGDNTGNLDSVAWYASNSGGQTHPVGEKQANAWGLYDMLGNVWEWCQDWYDANYYRNSPAEDPQGPSSGRLRVLRGGSWYDDSRYVRVAFRDRNDPGNRNYIFGFRCVRERFP